MTTTRTRRPRAAGLALAAVVCLATACSGTFKATATTGKAGEKLAQHEAAFASGPHSCDILIALGSASVDKCERINNQAPEWRKATAMLAQYATMLRKLAEAEDPDVADNVSSVVASAADAGWISLTDSQNEVLAKAANKLVQTITREYRRTIIAETVRSLDDHVEKVAYEFEAELKLHGAKVDAAIEVVTNLLTKKLVDSSVDKLQLANTKAELQARRESLNKARKDVIAFAKAHAKLKTKIEEGDFDDAKAYAEVIETIKAVYETTKDDKPTEEN